MPFYPGYEKSKYKAHKMVGDITIFIIPPISQWSVYYEYTKRNIPMINFPKTIVEMLKGSGGGNLHLVKTDGGYGLPDIPPPPPTPPLPPIVTPPPPPPPVEEEIEDDTVIKDFDFAVIRYRWLPSAGVDLDTRTYITTPARGDIKVGWARLRSDNNYLIWNDDNRGSGVESVLLDINKIHQDYPSETVINVKMDAFWYSAVADGKITLEFTTFKGGSMVVSGYDWVNQNGTPIQILTLPVNTIQQESSDINGENLATLMFDTVLKEGTLLGRAGPSIPLPGQDVGAGESTYMVFSVEDISSNGTPIQFRVIAKTMPLSPDWIFRDMATGDIIASGAVPDVRDGYTYTARTNGFTISFIPPTTSTDYSFTGLPADYAGFEYYSQKPHPSTPPPADYENLVPEIKLNLISFSTIIDSYGFYSDYVDLTVPVSLPPHITNLDSMFRSCYLFNQDLSGWDVSNVTEMGGMFEATRRFNGDITGWDTRNVRGMTRMFKDATAFNRDLSQWCVQLILSKPSNFDFNSILTPAQLPVWGTCPSQAGDGGPVVPVEPPRIPTPLTIEINNQAYGDVQTFVVEVPTYQTYVIKMNGDVIYANGVVAPGNGMSVDGEVRTLYFGAPPNAISGFVVEGELTSFEISTNAYTNQSTIFNVLNYSDTISRYGFSLKGSLLTVPQVLSPAITSTYEMFSECKNFNQDISMWDVSNVTNMYGMFNGATTFNQDLSGWDVSSYVSEPEYFSFFTPAWVLPKPVWGGVVIEPPVQSAFVFDVNTREQDGERTFTVIVPSGEACEIYRDGEIAYSTIFEDPLVSSSVISPNNTITITVPVGLMQTFRVIATPTLSKLELSVNSYSPALAAINVTSFSTDIVKYEFHTYNWNLSVQAPLPEHVTTTYLMFAQCHKFNSDISGWDMSNVVNASYMFTSCSIFNQNLANWNVANITNMTGMFYGTSVFNQDLSPWNVVGIPALPVDFAYGADGWTLPKPVWGTDGIPTADTFNFNFQGKESRTQVLWLYLRHDSGQSWSLTDENDVLISDSTGYSISGVTTEIYLTGTNKAEIRIEQTTTDIKYYKLKGIMNKAFVEYYSAGRSDRVGIAESEATLNITKYSGDIGAYGFSVGLADLTIPVDIPAHVIDTSYMFYYCYLFNQDISNWDVSNITNMANMFEGATTFNQDLSPWNVVGIPALPAAFASGAVGWTLPKPIWADGRWISTGYTQTDSTVTVHAMKRTSLGLFTTTILCPPDVENITQEIMASNLNEQVDLAVKQIVGSSTVVWELDNANQQITYSQSNQM